MKSLKSYIISIKNPLLLMILTMVVASFADYFPRGPLYMYITYGLVSIAIFWAAWSMRAKLGCHLIHCIVVGLLFSFSYLILFKISSLTLSRYFSEVKSPFELSGVIIGILVFYIISSPAVVILSLLGGLTAKKAYNYAVK